MVRVPRQKFHADFVRALRASGHSLRALAAFAEFSSHTNFSPFLTDRLPVPVSALNVERFQKLAAVIGYAGPIFKGAAR